MNRYNGAYRILSPRCYLSTIPQTSQSTEIFAGIFGCAFPYRYLSLKFLLARNLVLHSSLDLQGLCDMRPFDNTVLKSISRLRRNPVVYRDLGQHTLVWDDTAHVKYLLLGENFDACDWRRRRSRARVSQAFTKKEGSAAQLLWGIVTSPT